MENILRSHIVDVMHWLTKATRCFSGDLDQKECRACACANMAMSSLIQAKNECLRSGVDYIDYQEFFHRADICIREIVNSYADDHSQQWSFIEFDNLKASYEALPT